eukprot:RCo045376
MFKLTDARMRSSPGGSTVVCRLSPPSSPCPINFSGSGDSELAGVARWPLLASLDRAFRQQSACPSAARSLDRFSSSALACVLSAALLISTFGALHGFATTSQVPSVGIGCLVFVDAGSTGTRFHMYGYKPVWNVSAEIHSFVVDHVWTKSLDIPLHTALNWSAGEVRSTFSPLFRHVLSTAGPVAPWCRLFVWGTGGMRALPPEQQTAIYGKVFSLASVFAPKIRTFPAALRTISGDEEGFFGWVAANHHAASRDFPRALLQPLSTDLVNRSIGALDVGGASAQVAYLDLFAGPKGREIRPLDGSGSSHPLRRHVRVSSFMGYGAHKLERQLKRVLAKISTLLQRDGLHTLKLPNAVLASTSFWGMSLLHHLTHFLSIVDPNLPFPTPRLEEISKSAIFFCSIPLSEAVRRYGGRDPSTPVKRIAGRCFDAALVVTLLGSPHGLGFSPTSRQIQFVQQVPGGGELEWSFGAALATVAMELRGAAVKGQGRGPYAFFRGYASWPSFLILALVAGAVVVVVVAVLNVPPRWRVLSRTAWEQ